MSGTRTNERKPTTDTEENYAATFWKDTAVSVKLAEVLTDYKFTIAMVMERSIAGKNEAIGKRTLNYGVSDSRETGTVCFAGAATPMRMPSCSGEGRDGNARIVGTSFRGRWRWRDIPWR